jgi:hypothetical protein
MPNTYVCTYVQKVLFFRAQQPSMYVHKVKLSRWNLWKTVVSDRSQLCEHSGHNFLFRMWIHFVKYQIFLWLFRKKCRLYKLKNASCICCKNTLCYWVIAINIIFIRLEHSYPWKINDEYIWSTNVYYQPIKHYLCLPMYVMYCESQKLVSTGFATYKKFQKYFLYWVTTFYWYIGAQVHIGKKIFWTHLYMYI